MSLLDPKWRYTHSTDTDIRKTFKKARKELTKSGQADVRPAKLQLMPARSDAANSASVSPSIAARRGTRSADDVPNPENHDHPARVSTRLSGRLGA